MSARVRHVVAVLLTAIFVAPDLLSPPDHPNALAATSLELRLSSDVTDDDIRLVERERRVIHFNYTLTVTGDANHTLALAVCASVDDNMVALALVSKNAIVPLDVNVKGSFNVTVIGLFVGRANVHVHFVVGLKEHVECGQPAAGDLQELLRVSEANQGQEMDMNVTKASSDASTSSTPSPTSSSSVVGLHSGKRYAVVVLRKERPIDLVFQTGMFVLVIIINVGMGCKLDLQVVKATLKRPFAPITGLCSQFIVMPLVSFGVTQIFDLTPGVALGFFALGCSPGGSASNAFCYLLGGDVSLSVTMTLISTVASIGLLPMWMSTLGRYVSRLDDITIPFANIIYSLLGLVGAVGVGLLLKYKKPRWARVVITITKVVLVIFILFAMTVGIYANLYIFFLMRGVVLAAAAILPYTGFLLGGLVALLLRLPRNIVITVAIETGIQNTGVAVIVLLMSLDHPESDLSIVAPAASALFTPIPLWIAVAIYKLRRCYLRRKNGGDDSSATTNPESGDTSERSPESISVSTTEKNLCKKLFGKGTSCPVGGWTTSCLCCGSTPDEDVQTSKDLKIVTSGPDSSSGENATPQEGKCYEFDNQALERDAGNDEQSEHSEGTVPGQGEVSKSGNDSGSESASDVAYVYVNPIESTSF